MGKRIFLFVLTNIAIVLTLSIVVSLLGLNQGYRGGAKRFQPRLAVQCR